MADLLPASVGGRVVQEQDECLHPGRRSPTLHRLADAFLPESPPMLRRLLLVLVLFLPVSAADPEDGFVPLFNGKDLAGWKVYAGKAELWKAEDGKIVNTASGGG